MCLSGALVVEVVLFNMCTAVSLCWLASRVKRGGDVQQGDADNAALLILAMCISHFTLGASAFAPSPQGSYWLGGQC